MNASEEKETSISIYCKGLLLYRLLPSVLPIPRCVLSPICCISRDRHFALLCDTVMTLIGQNAFLNSEVVARW